MTTVQDVLHFIETLAPRSMKMDWDNVGLLCGNRNQPVRKILVALDPFENVCREAHEIGADLIVTHHPLIFRPVNSITDETSVGRSILFLAGHNISAINAHTNLDCSVGGVNDVLAQTVGLEDIEVISATGVDEEGRPWGLLRCGNVPSQSLAEFLTTVKKALHCPGLKYVDCGKPVSRVAVGGGACAGELMSAYRAGCDTFITSDVRYNQFWDAYELGINLIDAGHFHTENPICPVIASKLQAAFPEIVVKLSETHTDPAKFFI